MKRIFVVLFATMALALGAFAGTASASCPAWPKDHYWHYSPYYGIYFEWQQDVAIYGGREEIYNTFDGSHWGQIAFYC